MSGNGKIYAVIRNKTVIAMAQCELQYDSIKNRKKQPFAVLRRICVEEEWQNKKLGTRLVEKCGTWAKTNGCDELIIDCSEGDEKYIRGFGLLGFREQRKVKRYHKLIENNNPHSL